MNATPLGASVSDDDAHTRCSTPESNKSIIITDTPPREARNETREEERARWTAQTEETKISLRDLAENERASEQTRWFATRMARIIELWQIHAEDKEPTHHAIEFHRGPVTATLLQVFALVPECLQKYILVENEERVGDGDASWLCESIMDVIVLLRSDQGDPSTFFARGMASMVSDSVDGYYKGEFGKSYLEHLLHTMPDDLEGWTEGQSFEVPPTTERIVYFYNYTELHWTVGSIQVGLRHWNHTLFDSLSGRRRSTLLRGFRYRASLFQELIQTISGLPFVRKSHCRTGASPLQYNLNDCGVIAIYNAIELLHGRTPVSWVEPFKMRLHFLTDILNKLESLPQPKKAKEETEAAEAEALAAVAAAAAAAAAKTESDYLRSRDATSHDSPDNDDISSHVIVAN